jgi:putative hemolysin
MKQAILIMSVTALMTGCATPSAITPYGKDSYIISVDDVWGGNSPGKLQVKAAQEANAYCAQQGKVLRVRNTSGQGTAGWTSTSSTLVFSCIAEHDVENTRPELRKEAETVIEDRRE